jgi:hypothetical protein
MRHFFPFTIPCYLCCQALSFSGCSSHKETSPAGYVGRTDDAGVEFGDAAAIEDAGTGDARLAADAWASNADTDAGTDLDASAPTVTGMAIVSAYGTPLQGAPGDVLQLTVLLTMSDGTTRAALDNQVSWLAPPTLVAEDPYDAGADIVPEAGAQATGFFVQNDYRESNLGVLYITASGSVPNPTITVFASIVDAGEVSAAVSILPAPAGDVASGLDLFQHAPGCGVCHGSTGAGSPPALFPDGGAVLIDGGAAYFIAGQLYPYPAPGLNNAPDSGNLASDPAWNAALLAMAAQSDIDNRGVALRNPMPDWFGGKDPSGRTLGAQDFADIYAWLKTQTE